MAKWGEGDPRWIVEERADATNVNNWHWTEKNATPWSKDKLNSLLKGLVIEDEKYFCEIKEVTKIEGEASANNRKAKLFFFYEWEITAKWTGRVKAADDVDYKGEIEIPNLSEEHSPEEVDINVSLDDKHSEGMQVKEYIRTKGVKIIREQLKKYTKDLREEFSQGMILPAKDGATDTPAPSADSSCSKNIAKNAINQSVASKDGRAALGVKIPCKNLTETEEFKCAAPELYRALTDKDMVRAFTQGDAIVESFRGGRFVMFGGNILGEFTDLVTNEKIEMRWRNKSWPDEHYSNVTLELRQKDDCTELVLTQTGIPIGDYEKTREGWKNHYWRSIKQTFGYGAMFF